MVQHVQEPWSTPLRRCFYHIYDLVLGFGELLRVVGTAFTVYHCVEVNICRDDVRWIPHCCARASRPRDAFAQKRTVDCVLWKAHNVDDCHLYFPSYADRSCLGLQRACFSKTQCILKAEKGRRSGSGYISSRSFGTPRNNLLRRTGILWVLEVLLCLAALGSKNIQKVKAASLQK